MVIITSPVHCHGNAYRDQSSIEPIGGSSYDLFIHKMAAGELEHFFARRLMTQEVH